nr:MAG TPA_asm: hypothetical protein [Caudoviricetes sp.]DAM12476.1 MAG TPA: hypothetical protein [Caudoviricetes sp.]
MLSLIFLLQGTCSRNMPLFLCYLLIKSNHEEL